jgi:hypothetical protein
LYGDRDRQTFSLRQFVPIHSICALCDNLETVASFRAWMIAVYYFMTSRHSPEESVEIVRANGAAICRGSFSCDMMSIVNSSHFYVGWSRSVITSEEIPQDALPVHIIDGIFENLGQLAAIFCEGFSESGHLI